MVLTFAQERLKNKFANFFRTQSAVLMKARRGHHTAGEKEEELKTLLQGIQNAIEARETDSVEESTKKAAKDITEMMQGLARVEETELMVEYDMIHPLDEIIEWTEKLLHILEHLKTNLTFTDEITKTKRVLEELKQMKNFESKTLKAQYGALLRSLEGKPGDWQTMVVAINERMNASQAMWRERSETRAVKKEENEERHEIHKAIELVESAQTGDISKRQELAETINMILKHTEQLKKDFEQMLQDFLLIIHVLVHEWFQYDKESTEFFAKLNKQLETLGYPPVEEEEIHNIEKEALKDKQVAAEIVVKVARRIGRIENNT